MTVEGEIPMVGYGWSPSKPGGVCHNEKHPSFSPNDAGNDFGLLARRLREATLTSISFRRGFSRC